MRGKVIMVKQITTLLIGAGNRGLIYVSYATHFPDQLKVVGVAEPDTFRRQQILEKCRINPEHVYQDWRTATEKEKFADCVLICTPDQQHKEPAIAFANKGYHVLLEKPMAVRQVDCEAILEACRSNNIIMSVSHILRHTPQAVKVKEIIDSGAIGDVVGYQKFAHSFVRGNWNNSEKSCFSLLAKSCHDLDLIAYWSSGKKTVAVSSFGSLMHFTNDNKPKAATSRCLDCSIERTCLYSAKRIYLDSIRKGNTQELQGLVTDVPDIENVTEALKTGPYGKCVYESDNNVCDNQVVNIQFDDGSTASFSMVAYTKKISERQVKVFGTMGEINCDFDSMKVIQHDFTQNRRIPHNLTNETRYAGENSRYGGANFSLVKTFLEAVSTNDPSKILTGPMESLESHILCFKAEQSRLQNKVMLLPT